MRLTAQTYADAADRLEALADSPDALVSTGDYNQHVYIDYQAQDWALQLRGAAEALAHYQGREDDLAYKAGYDDGKDEGYNEGFNEGVASIEPDLDGARNAIWDFLDRRDSPAPEIRDRALEILEGCVARWNV